MSAAVDALEPLPADLSLKMLGHTNEPLSCPPSSVAEASSQHGQSLAVSVVGQETRVTPPAAGSQPVPSRSNSSQRCRKLWRKAAWKLSALGKGCAEVPHEQFLVMLPDHWVEVFDPLHRCHLKPYFLRWKTTETDQNFYRWLDYGEGKHMNLEQRPRRVLDKQHVVYFSHEARDCLEVEVDDQGLLVYRVDGTLVDTGSEVIVETPMIRRHSLERPLSAELALSLARPLSTDDLSAREKRDREQEEAEELAALRLDEGDDSPVRWMVKEGDSVRSLRSSLDIDDSRPAKADKNRWIYVLDMDDRLFINKKVPGKFHHSSLSLGAPVRGAGSISVMGGRISTVTAWSGHYRPSHKAFAYVIRYLSDRGVDMSNVKQYFSKSEVPGHKSKAG